MSAIFISHSSRDDAAAAELKARLADQGHRSVFLDFDPEDGIPAGRDWEQELYHRVRASRAVIVLCSRASMASRWCFMEITHARALGKHLFPVKVEDCDVDAVLTDRQVIDLTADKEKAYARLWRGILAAGLDPADAFDWDGSRPPYPGLLAFQEEDAAIFFGRDDEIGDGLDLLNKAHRLGETGLVMVLGASGSGKSSLARAGLLPRLRRDVERWLVVDPFRPRDDPARELAAALARAFGGGRTPDELERRLRAAMAAAAPVAGAREERGIETAGPRRYEDAIRSLQASLPEDASPRARRYLRLLKAELEPGDAPEAEPEATATVLGELAAELRLRSGRSEARVLLVVDQFEELLGHPDDHPGSRFLALLRAAAEGPHAPVLVLGTMRSDFLGLFQKSPALLDLRYESLSLGPMAPEDVVQAVEKPAELAAVDLESGLVRAMVDDAETDDALPLLAFTLRELYERFGKDGKLHLSEYRERLGGLQGAVAKAADEVLESAALGPQDEKALKAAFLAMVRVTDEGGWSRRPAFWDDLPAAVHPLLERFVQARLLISGSDGQRRTLEVAHEALFRSWERLVAWLDQSAEALRLRHEVQRAARGWDQEGRGDEYLWHGARLARARELIAGGDLPLEDVGLMFVEVSAAAERARLDAEAGQRRRIERLKLWGLVATLVGALVTAFIAWKAVENRRRAQNDEKVAAIARQGALAAMNFAESQRLRVDVQQADDERTRKALQVIEPKYREQSKAHLTRAEELRSELLAWRLDSGVSLRPPEVVFSLEVVRAGSGACAILHFGPPASPHLVLVDGGDAEAYLTSLRPRLDQLRRERSPQGPLPLELVISAQAEEDHIQGLERLLEELKRSRDAGRAPLAEVRVLWSNVFLPPDEEVRRLLADQGKGLLTKTAGALGIPVNEPFTRLVTLPDKGSARVAGPSEELTLTILGPSLEGLRRFAQARIRDMRGRAGKDEQVLAVLARLEGFELIEDFASDKIELVPSPPQVEAPAPPAVEDDLFTDLASIVLMVESGDDLESGGRRMLLPADAGADHLLAALAQAGYSDSAGATEVDVLVLPHGGSHHASEDFFRRVKARHYVVLGNGSDTNPDLRTFEMLFAARREDARPFTLHLSYRPAEYAVIDNTYPADELCALFERQREAGTPFDVVVPREGEASLSIDLLLETSLDKGTSSGVCPPPAAAGVTRDTPEVAGGTIVRDEDGEPTGGEQGRVAVGQGAEGLAAVLRILPETKEAVALVAQGDDAPEAAGHRLAGGHEVVVLVEKSEVVRMEGVDGCRIVVIGHGTYSRASIRAGLPKDPNPKGVLSRSPGSARSAPPWVDDPKDPNPNGVLQVWPCLEASAFIEPRWGSERGGAGYPGWRASRLPWALKYNPVGVKRHLASR